MGGDSWLSWISLQFHGQNEVSTKQPYTQVPQLIFLGIVLIGYVYMVDRWNLMFSMSEETLPVYDSNVEIAGQQDGENYYTIWKETRNLWYAVSGLTMIGPPLAFVGNVLQKNDFWRRFTATVILAIMVTSTILIAELLKMIDEKAYPNQKDALHGCLNLADNGVTAETYSKKCTRSYQSTANVEDRQICNFAYPAECCYTCPDFIYKLYGNTGCCTASTCEKYADFETQNKWCVDLEDGWREFRASALLTQGGLVGTIVVALTAMYIGHGRMNKSDRAPHDLGY